MKKDNYSPKDKPLKKIQGEVATSELKGSMDKPADTHNPMEYCINCGKYLGFRGFCSEKCHNEYYDSRDNISLCKSCFCMTHTIKGKCGKCKAIKDNHSPQEQNSIGDKTPPIAPNGEITSNVRDASQRKEPSCKQAPTNLLSTPADTHNQDKIIEVIKDKVDKASPEELQEALEVIEGFEKKDIKSQIEKKDILKGMSIEEIGEGIANLKIKELHHIDNLGYQRGIKEGIKIGEQNIDEAQIRQIQFEARREGVRIGEQKAQALWDIINQEMLLYTAPTSKLEQIKKEFGLK